MARRRIKIVSDGTTAGTSVVDAETGQEIDGVCAVRWEADAAEGWARVTLEMFRVPVEVIGEVTDGQEEKEQAEKETAAA